MLSGIVHLDVGGSHFTTSIATLTRDPKSLLANIVYDSWLSEKHKAIFIDRDGTHFRYILNYLRDGSSVVLPEDRQTVTELLNEVLFYGLSDLKEMLKDRLGLLTSGSSSSNSAKSGSSLTVKTMTESSATTTHSISDCCHRLSKISESVSGTPGDLHHHSGESGASFSGASSTLTESDITTGMDFSFQETGSVAPPLKVSDLVQWRQAQFDIFWGNFMATITSRGYIDWLRCPKCGNDYELRLPEQTKVIEGFGILRNYLLDMKGRIDSVANDTCVYVTWRSVYCAKDGYLDSLRFPMHVPICSVEQAKPS